jgi:hypothetical protein
MMKILKNPLLIMLLILFSCENKPETNYDGSLNMGKTNKPTYLTTVSWDHYKYDLGKTTYGEEKIHYFKVTNTGKYPLHIYSATASCGCTMPEKPEAPIAPGDTYDLKVIFSPKVGQKGTEVTKEIKVNANTIPANSILEISTSVNP